MTKWKNRRQRRREEKILLNEQIKKTNIIQTEALFSMYVTADYIPETVNFGSGAINILKAAVGEEKALAFHKKYVHKFENVLEQLAKDYDKLLKDELKKRDLLMEAEKAMEEQASKGEDKNDAAGAEQLQQ